MIMAPWILMFKKRNKTRYSLALILLFVILCSCNGKKSSVLIHNNNFKFWQMIDPSHKISKTIYYFDKNEKWLVFAIQSSSGEPSGISISKCYSFIKKILIIRDVSLNAYTKVKIIVKN